MRRDDRAGHVVGRMLDGDELLNLIFLRQNDHARRVLTRRALHADAAQRQPVHLRLRKRQIPLLAVFLDIAVSRLIRQRADGSRAIAVSLAEQLLDVGVRARLIHAREVQVDIRHLVALEPEEDLERDIESVAVKLLAALRALHRRQVNADLVFALVHIERVPFAFRAAIVRRQRVDLRYADQMRHIG